MQRITRPSIALLLLLTLVSMLQTGCVSSSSRTAINPSFPISRQDAASELLMLRQDPQPAQRPIVILGGYLDPGFAGDRVAGTLRPVFTDDTPIIKVSFLGTTTFDGARDSALRTVLKRFPLDEGQTQTIEVDVIGISMGGLVARYAAMPRHEGDVHLKVRRMFTLASPHRGAKMAALPSVVQQHADMRRGSAFLQQLDAALALADYELICYARLGDGIVGESLAAPDGYPLWWVPPGALSASHMHIAGDQRIMADIARRLRGLPPLTIAPAAALPRRPATPVPDDSEDDPAGDAVD